MLDIHSLLDPKCYCPCYCCVQNDCSSCEDDPHKDTTSVLKKLVVLIHDKEARELVTRHVLLLNHYIGITKKKLKLHDLPYFCVVLEHLCENVKQDNSYLPVLVALLEMIQTPLSPSLIKDKQLRVTLSDYLTTIGHCLHHVPGQKMKKLLISSYSNTLTTNVPSYSIRYQFLWADALNESCLPMLLSDLLLSLKGIIFFELVQSILVVLEFSANCAEDFVVSKCVENLLMRWTELTILKGKLKYHFGKVMTNIILILLTCVPEEQVRNVSPPMLPALLNLREWLHWEIIQHDSSRRNEVIAIICRLVYLYPNLDVINSNIMKDIFLLTFCPHPEIDDSWAQGWIFDKDNIMDSEIASMSKTLLPADYECRELLLATSRQFIKMGSAKIIVKEMKICSELPELMIFKQKLKGKKAFIWSQMKIILELIALLSQILPDDVIESGVPRRLMALIKYFHKCWEGQGSVFHQSLICLNTLLENEKFILIFKSLDCIKYLLTFLCTLVTKSSAWTLSVQSSLTRIMMILSCFAARNDCVVLFSDVSTKPLCSVLNRISKSHVMDTKIDPSLTLSTFDLIWKTDVLLHKNRQHFINNDGVSLSLDILEESAYPVQIVILGMLVDLLESELAIPYVVMWRSKTSKISFLSLLCKLWRICEEKKNVSRNASGSMENIHKPLAGKKSEVDISIQIDSFPPLLEMSLCMRPKIYCIISLLLGIHIQLVESLEESTNIPFKVLSRSDQITMQLIEFYEIMKEGEIWCDIRKKLPILGVEPLPSEEQLLHLLDLKHLAWARDIQCRQKFLESAILRKSIDKEKKLYIKLKSFSNSKTFNIYDILKSRALIEDSKLRSNIKKQIALKESKPCRKDCLIFKHPIKANIITESVRRRIKCYTSPYMTDNGNSEDTDEYRPTIKSKVSFLVPNYAQMDTGEVKNKGKSDQCPQ